MADKELIPHLFRTEYSKIVSVLCKTFGLSNLEFAEDMVSDTFLAATETWGLKGIPENPTAWLYTVAKNKARDVFRRDKIFDHKIRPQLEQQHLHSSTLDIDLSKHNIQDSQLQMLFAVCNPIISNETQIALALRVLCGFGIGEIASAFLSNKETINKRLQRGKEKLRKSGITIEMPSMRELEGRLQSVTTTLYLLFNEGYYSANSEVKIRKDLCLEAMRLNYQLLNHKTTNTPKTNALMALFCFHASRFDARTTTRGEQVVYADQNPADWDSELIQKGEKFLHLSGTGNAITKFHLEAIIAYYHTRTDDSSEKWEHILQMYNQLLQIEYSPITALNRTYALAMANTVEEAITECLKIDLNQNHLYHLLLAELYTTVDLVKKRQHLHKAAALAESKSERKWIMEKLAVENKN